MTNKLISITIMLFTLFSSKAQKVESKSYDIMLKALLSHSVNEVSVAEIQDVENILFVDCRERKEFEVSHLKNAIWVGYDSLNLDNLANINKNQRIIAYCSIGYRSEKVSLILKEKGYTNVSNLYGGIFEWKNQTKVVVNSRDEPTDSVHAYNRAWGIWLNRGEKVY